MIYENLLNKNERATSTFIDDIINEVVDEYAASKDGISKDYYVSTWVEDYLVSTWQDYLHPNLTFIVGEASRRILTQGVKRT